MGESLFSNNSRSVEFCEAIISSVEQTTVIFSRSGISGADTKRIQDALSVIEKNIQNEEKNITEVGEYEAIISVRNNFALFKKAVLAADKKNGHRGIGEILSLAVNINADVHKIAAMNLNAIGEKSKRISEYENKFYMYISILATICFLVSFSFIFNFPDIAGSSKRSGKTESKSPENR
jgi:hypothetical protein